MSRRREAPVKRKNPSGKVVWVARWTTHTGQRRYGWPPEIKGTYRTKGEAQDAIDACYEKERLGPALPSTVGAYAASWTQVHPRAKVTDKTNESRLRAVLDVKLEGAPFRDWPFEMLRRRHANALADHMLRVQERTYTGANAILGTISAMVEDAIEDEAAVTNPFRGMKKIRANDPRIVKVRRPVRVVEWGVMHALARACAESGDGGPALVAWRRVYAEPMIRMLSDCGLRVGELFALCRSDLNSRDGLLEVRWSASLGEILPGTKHDHYELGAGRVVPVAPELLAMLARIPARLDGVVTRGGVQERLLFPTAGGVQWSYSHWHRRVWAPGTRVAGVDVRPHELRHSWVSLMWAAGIDPADLADAGGHSVETATKTYVHGLRRSFDAMRKAVGDGG